MRSDLPASKCSPYFARSLRDAEAATRAAAPTLHTLFSAFVSMCTQRRAGSVSELRHRIVVRPATYFGRKPNSKTIGRSLADSAAYARLNGSKSVNSASP